MPSRSHAPPTSGRTGRASSSSTTASPASRASSLQTVATPPRVGSRSQRVPGAACSRASTSPPRGAVSDTRSASRARSPRASMTAMPWSPSVPETSTLSPGRTSSAPSRRPAGRSPTPAVVTYTPSAEPLPTTLVSPVTTVTPAAAAAPAMSAATERRSSTAKPSSMTNAAESQRGRAPMTARSLTVPCTARWPIEPPGNLHGDTTKLSVDMTRRSPPGRSRTAPSSRGPSVPNAGANTDSISAAEALPPAPWARLTTSSRRRGLRRRNASMRSRTAASLPGSGLPLTARHPSCLVAPGTRGSRSSPGPLRRRLRPGEAVPQRRPQGEAQRRLGLLDAVDALRAHDQAVVDRVASGHLPPVVAGEAHGEHAEPLRLGEGGEEDRRVAAGREADRHVGRPAVGDHLAGEDQLEADVVAEGAQHAGVGGQVAGGQRPSPVASGHQSGEGGGVVGAAPVAEGQHPPARGEARRHRLRHSGDLAGQPLQRFRGQSAALRFLGLGRGRQVGEQAGGVALVRLDERVEEVGHRSALDMAVPAWTSTTSPSRGASTSVASTVSNPAEERTVTSPCPTSTTSPRRPSSEQVTQ